MRNVIFSLLLAAAGAIGLAAAPAAEAYDSGRIFVGIGDVTFSYGRPYHRYDRAPLYVVYEYGYPRYYRIVPPRYYAPRYAYAPPIRWRSDDRYYGGHRHDGRRYWERDRRHWRDRHWD